MTSGCARACVGSALLGLVLAAGTPLAAHGGATDQRDAGRTERVSVSSSGTEGNGAAGRAAVSDSGRYVVFESRATNLVPGDHNGLMDVFIRDRAAQTTRLVSVASDGTQADHASHNPVVSADGRYVVFDSHASNLVPGDTNHAGDVFVRDVRTGTTRRVSVSGQGAEGDCGSALPSISADGRYVAFATCAANLTPADRTHLTDILVTDLRTGAIDVASVNDHGETGRGISSDPYISATGRFVVFTSDAGNLGDTAYHTHNVFLRDRRRHITRLVTVGLDGRFRGDARGFGVSANGRYVVFASMSNQLVADVGAWNAHVFLRDVHTGTTQLVSRAPGGRAGDSDDSAMDISANGRFVAFTSFADNLVPGDSNRRPDVFVWNRRTGRIVRVSLSGPGEQVAGGTSWTTPWYGPWFGPSLSASGRVVTFEASVAGFVPGDGNRTRDVFVRVLPGG